MTYEKVHTIYDYYDGPRAGVADHSGHPHWYSCVWSAEDDEYTDVFELRPLDDETMNIEMEAWSIWREWEARFSRGEVSTDSHPGNPGQNPHFLSLRDEVARRVANIPVSRRAKGAFRVCDQQHPDVLREMEVQWEDAR